MAWMLQLIQSQMLAGKLELVIQNRTLQLGGLCTSEYKLECMGGPQFHQLGIERWRYAGRSTV